MIGFSFFFAFGQFILLPLFLQRFGIGPGSIGLMLSALALSSMISRPILGWFSPAIGLRRLAIGATLLWAASSSAYFLITSSTLWLIFPMRILQGIACGAIDIVVTTIPARLSPPGEKARGFGIISTFFVLGWSLSPAVAERAMDWYGFPALFSLSIFASSLAFLAAVALRLPTSVRPTTTSRLTLFGSWRQTLNGSFALVLLTVFLGMGVTAGAYSNFIPLYAASRGVGAGSAFYLFNSITSVLARLLLSGVSDRIGRRKVLAPAFVLGLIVLALLYDLRSVTAIVAAGLIYGLQNGLQMPAMVAHVTDTQKGDADPALALGLMFTAFDAGSWFSASTFGFVAEAIGYGPAYVSLAGSLLAALALLLVRARASSSGPNT